MTNGAVVLVYNYSGDESAGPVPRTVMHVKIDNSLRRIPDQAFADCRDLVTVELPPCVEAIGQDAFSECTSLQYIFIPPTVQHIGKCCFFRCKSLVSVTLPHGLRVIEKVAFCGCYALETIHIPTTVKEIRDEAFLNCDSLVTINLPEGLRVIAEGAFNWCNSLLQVRIPSTVVEIGRCCFARCGRLISIELPEFIETIGEQAFVECKELLHIAIPSSTSHIGENVLEACDLLTSKFRGLNLLKHAKGRFDDCPVHELCYYQANRVTDFPRHIDELMGASSGQQRDAFGMSPFHILALSQIPSLRMWQLLQEASSSFNKVDLLLETDAFGYTPLEYLCSNEDPSSITLVTSMLQTTIAQRIRKLGLLRWRDNAWDLLDAFLVKWQFQDPEFRMDDFRIHFGEVLENYEQKERLSLLELAIWRVALERAKYGILVLLEGGGARKKAKLDHSKKMNILDASDRENCRIHCGADIVVSNVLPFLEGS